MKTMESLPDELLCRIIEAASAGDDVKTLANLSSVNKRLHVCAQKARCLKTVVMQPLMDPQLVWRRVLWLTRFGRSLHSLDVGGAMTTLDRVLKIGFKHPQGVVFPKLEDLTFRHESTPLAHAQATTFTFELPGDLRFFRFVSTTYDSNFELKGGACLESLVLDGGGERTLAPFPKLRDLYMFSDQSFQTHAPVLAEMRMLTTFQYIERTEHAWDMITITPEILPAIRALTLDVQDGVPVSIARGMPTLETLELGECHGGSIEVTPDFLRGSPALRVFTAKAGFSTAISDETSRAFGDTALERVAIDTMNGGNETIVLPRTARWVNLNTATMTDATFAKRPSVEELLMPDYNMGRPEMDGSVIDWLALRLVGVDIVQIPAVMPRAPVLPGPTGPKLTILVCLNDLETDDDFDERVCIAALEPIGALVKKVIVCVGAEASGRFEGVNYGAAAFNSKSVMTRAVRRACPGAGVLYQHTEMNKEFKALTGVPDTDSEDDDDSEDGDSEDLT